MDRDSQPTGPAPHRQPRIFMGVKEVAGYYTNLKKGFDQLGITSTFVPFDAHPFGYGQGARIPWLARLVRYARASAKTHRKQKRKRKRAFWERVEEVASFLFLLWVVPRFDVFIFGYRTSIRRLKDLPLLRRMGKTIVFVFHGSDSRPPYLNGSFMAADRGTTLEKCIRKTAEHKAELVEIERWADFIIAHPPSSQLHERSAVSWLSIGVPFELDPPGRDGAAVSSQVDPSEDAASGGVRILHAASHPEAKGTPLIRETIASLRRRGHEIDFVEILRQPHAVVLQELSRCDFVIDELYSDTPMAVFATEAAFHAKPTVVGSYAIETLHELVAEDDFPPTQLCHPDDFEASVEKLILDPAYRRDLGRRAFEFVSERWSSRTVAERVLRLTRGQAPREWFFDPRQIRYVYGYGSSEEVVRERVRSLYERYGGEALQLGDKPAFEARLHGFAVQASAPHDEG